jgi:hypothetical protein
MVVNVDQRPGGVPETERSASEECACLWVLRGFGSKCTAGLNCKVLEIVGEVVKDVCRCDSCRQSVW